MLHFISDIMDYLLSQVQGCVEAGRILPGRPAGAADREPPAAPFSRFSSGSGLEPETVIHLITQDMLTEESLDLFFPMPPVEMPDIVCYRLMLLPESGLQPLVLMIYYNPRQALKIEQPHYVLDNDVWVENGGRFWTFVSVVTGSLDEAACFVEIFINHLGLSPCFEVAEVGGRLQVLRARHH